MDELIKRISEQLAGQSQSSRRRFFSTMGKAVLGAAAFVAGQSFFSQAAEASPACCSNGGTQTCPNMICPHFTHQTYTWKCGTGGGHGTICHDCRVITTGKLYCVYATMY